MIRTTLDNGINWNWYLCADYNEWEKTVHIYYYDRWHKYEFRGTGHPVHENNHATLLEDDKRIVYGIKLDGVDYLVSNPGYIFSYKDMTYYKSE